MLQRSLAGNYAKSIFFEQHNDIDIYIEDTTHGYNKIYTTLLNKVFDGRYSIKRVFPLGGKEAVLQKWQTAKQTRRAELFIIDGDLDQLIQKPNISKGSGLYCHGFYCIENILICENAFIELLNEDDPVLTKTEIRKRLQFSNWVRLNNSWFYELYMVYALSMKIKPESQTIAYPIKNLVSDASGNLDKEKTKRRINEVMLDVIGVCGRKKAYDELRELKTSNPKVKDFMLTYVSGKDHLFPLIMIKARNLTVLRRENIQVKNALSQKAELTKLGNINEYIRN